MFSFPIFMKNFNSFFLVLLLVIFLSETAYSQMFSVEEPQRRMRLATRSVEIGPDFIEMKNRNINGEMPDYAFSDPVYRVRVRYSGVETYAAYNRGLGKADTTSYLNIGANISSPMPVSTTGMFRFSLPLTLSTEFIRVQSTESGQDDLESFRQTSASLGVGPEISLRLNRNFRVNAGIIPQFGFTILSLGSDTGQLVSVNGRISVSLGEIYENIGLTAGYHYKWQRYTDRKEEFLYDISSNYFSIGLTF